MNKLLLLLIINLFSILVVSGQQRIIFKDNFENNDMDWLHVKNKEFSINIDSGKLSIQKNTINRIMNGCLWYKKTIHGFATQDNFSISFDAKSMANEFDGWAFDFQWGKMQEQDGKRINSLYQIDFGLEKVRLAKFELGKGWKYFSWSNQLMEDGLSPFKIEREKWNKFEIIQQDGIVFVKINNTLVYKIPIEVVIGSEIGFQQCLKSKWELDNLIIKQ